MYWKDFLHLILSMSIVIQERSCEPLCASLSLLSFFFS